jgi:hypothetical protein
MSDSEQFLADYVEKLFAKTSLLALALRGYSRVVESGARSDGGYLDEVRRLATEVEFGLGKLHDRLASLEEHLVT